MNYKKLSLKELYHLKDALECGEQELQRQWDDVVQEIGKRKGEEFSDNLRKLLGLLKPCSNCGKNEALDGNYCSEECAEDSHFNNLEAQATGN